MRQNDVLLRFQQWTKTKTPEELGNALISYVSEANHIDCWDGFPRRDLTGIRKFLEDYMIYLDNCL